MPSTPMKCQLEFGANVLYARIASFWELRPIINSASKIGIPMKIVKSKKIKKNAPPPDLPAIYGNFQIAPSPMADPAVARINPSLDVHCSVCCFISDMPLSYFNILKLKTYVSILVSVKNVNKTRIKIKENCLLKVKNEKTI